LADRIRPDRRTRDEETCSVIVFVARSGRDAEVVDARLPAEGRPVSAWSVVAQIEPRADWEAIAAARIRDADALLFVTSPDSVKSVPCLVELRLALEAERPCHQWLLRPVPAAELPQQLRRVPVVAVGVDVDPSAWFVASG
jgi:hypothetical protein